MAERGRPKGSKNKRTLSRERATARISQDPDFDPYEYIRSVGLDARKFNQRKAWAAETLMPYIYPRLSASKVDALVRTEATGEQITDADSLFETVLMIRLEAPKEHA